MIAIMRRRYAPNRLREIRRAKGMTLEQVGSSMQPELTLASVQKLETSQMALSLDYILDLARVLDVSPHEIIAGPESTPMRLVPMIDLDQLNSWECAVLEPKEIVAVPMDCGGNRCFAVRDDDGVFDRIVRKEGVLVIDPDQFELVEDRVFVVRPANGSAKIVRFRLNPPRTEPCSHLDGGEDTPLGREVFSILGRVTYALSPI